MNYEKKKADTREIVLIILAMTGNRRLQNILESFRATLWLEKCDFVPCLSYTGVVAWWSPALEDEGTGFLPPTAAL